MVDRRALEIGALLWAGVAFAVATVSLATAGSGVPVLVGLATVVFPLCAVLAYFALGHGRSRVAGALLVASAATPTYFAWIINVPALLAGIALVIAPRAGAWGARRRPRRAS